MKVNILIRDNTTETDFLIEGGININHITSWYQVPEDDNILVKFNTKLLRLEFISGVAILVESTEELMLALEEV